MVAGRDRDHAALALLRTELVEPVERAAHLERPGALKELRLQDHLRAEVLGQGARMEERRAMDAPGDRSRRALDVFDRDHARETTRAGTASLMVNRVCLPGSLSTETVPPMASVSSLTIASPRPVPTGRSRP